LWRLLLFLLLSVGSYLAHAVLDGEISNIKQESPELFSGEIKPYKVIEDYNSPTGRPGDIEDESKVYYTKEDRMILDERKRLLGPLPFLSGFCGFLSIGSAIIFIALLYFKIDDWREERRIKSNKKKQEAENERICRINQAFIDKVENIIESHESLGTAITYREVLEIRKEMKDMIRVGDTNF
jgi:hypothetical protein